ncbi:hypothetical protein A2U01_0073017, partial [Trifolium medium]|nr:hypothetical protein [Trifolium medium]
MSLDHKRISNTGGPQAMMHGYSILDRVPVP